MCSTKMFELQITVPLTKSAIIQLQNHCCRSVAPVEMKETDTISPVKLISLWSAEASKSTNGIVL